MSVTGKLRPGTSFSCTELQGRRGTHVWPIVWSAGVRLLWRAVWRYL